MVEIPDAKRCCFCFPLRHGLLFIAYLKLAAGFGITLFMVYITILLQVFHILDNFGTAAVTVIFLILIMGITFDFMFIIGAHEKNVTYVRIYYRYLWGQLVCYVVLLVAYIPWIIVMLGASNDVVATLAGGIGALFIAAVLHVYFIYLLRSEMRKLELSTLFSFRSHADEPECSVQIIS